jgi:hypothetical protein
MMWMLWVACGGSPPQRPGEDRAADADTDADADSDTDTDTDTPDLMGECGERIWCDDGTCSPTCTQCDPGCCSDHGGCPDPTDIGAGTTPGPETPVCEGEAPLLDGLTAHWGVLGGYPLAIGNFRGPGVLCNVECDVSWLTPGTSLELFSCSGSGPLELGEGAYGLGETGYACATVSEDAEGIGTCYIYTPEETHYVEIWVW